VWTEATETSESHLSYPRQRAAIRRLLARLVDGFVDAGTEARAYAKSLLPPGRSVPFFRSHNAIDNDGFVRQCEAFRGDAAGLAMFRSRFPARNILFSGQLIERKNIRRLIDVYEEILRTSDGPVGLIVLGQGPLEGYLAARKRERNLRHLYLEGFQAGGDNARYFVVADLFILLSVYDCNPLVIFEALAAGLPTICSKHCGNAVDLIEDGSNGYIVDPDNVADVAAKTRALLDAADRGAMADAARRMARKSNYGEAAGAFVDAVTAVAGRGQ
jgi:glycosyltransferase involved in cell wall biosynthesis